MTKDNQQVDILPDLSQELASMGRGSMQRRIQLLEAALAEADETLNSISNSDSLSAYQATVTLERMDKILNR